MTTPASGEVPLVLTKTSQVDAAAVGVDTQTVVCEAPFAGSVSRVTYTPVTTITGANTNSRTLTVTERGATGVGSTNVATLALVSGVNAAADAEKALTLSAAANLVVAAGDVISFESTHVGTGIADPGGQVLVEFTRG
jgi:hypothetical protein